jgi:DNA-binding protein H-NS
MFIFSNYKLELNMTHLVDFSSYDLDVLYQMSQDVQKAIREKEEAKLSAALNAAKKAAKDLGYDLDDIHQGQGGKNTGDVYVNPKNSSETWIGRGRRPKWLNALIESGVDIETLKKNR